MVQSVNQQRTAVVRVTQGAVAICVGIDFGAVSSVTRLPDHAARSIVLSGGLSLRLPQPSPLRIVIWPEASKAQNNMAAVSAEGSTVWVLIRRLNSSCNRSIAFEGRSDFHWLFRKRVKVNNLSPASSRLVAAAGHFSRHLRTKAFRFASISGFVSA